jgi:hypothetical protein
MGYGRSSLIGFPAPRRSPNLFYRWQKEFFEKRRGVFMRILRSDNANPNGGFF